jgi:exo-rhamnogalacturonan lyase-like protein
MTDVPLVQLPRIHVSGAGSFTRRGEPVTVGVPFPKSCIRETSDLGLRNSAGRSVPSQARALDRWSDGSIRWALVDLLADIDAGQSSSYQLVAQQSDFRLQSSDFAYRSLTVAVEGSAISIDTGAARFHIATDKPIPFGDVIVDGRAVLDGARTGIEIVDTDGRHCPLHVDDVAIEDAGSIRATICGQGAVRAPTGAPLFDLTYRIHFFAGSSVTRCQLTLRNPRRAVHPGGIWELGDAGSLYVKDVSVAISPVVTGAARHVLCSPECGVPLTEWGEPFELYQDSSGGPQWNSATHVNRNSRVPNRFRGYHLTAARSERRADRVTPVVVLKNADHQVAVAAPYFWQRFPKAVEAGDGRLVLRLLPRQYDDVHEIQGGEQLTEEFCIAFGNDAISEIPLDWGRTPARARLDAEWYCRSGAMPHLVPASQDPNRGYDSLVGAALVGDRTFAVNRERADEYGWRHFGDLHADHEAVGTATMVSHYNNQYDAIAGMACQFFRTGNIEWLSLLIDLARHVIDTDIYHTTEDKPAYNRGMFWHTAHYTDAGKSTHRTYPAGTNGGGPSAEHNYNSGLMLYYFLTGDARGRDAAIDLGRWVIDMDDGSKTPLSWLSRRPTGLASASGSRHYHGPGRGPANSIVAVLNAYRLTGERLFLAKAEELIRRSVHPQDDIAALNLLDAERRWFYTVFLQALGMYLDVKMELKELDAMYAYARQTLLHYARWMAVNEYPYLDKPEILEYPTETWAAQDIRKSVVFDYAALHASGDERRVFLERASWFFNYSTTTLANTPTRGLVRPVVILLSNGCTRAFFQTTADLAAPVRLDAPAHIGRRSRFVPQRTVAMKRLIGLGILGSLSLLALAIA